MSTTQALGPNAFSFEGGPSQEAQHQMLLRQQHQQQILSMQQYQQQQQQQQQQPGGFMQGNRAQEQASQMQMHNANAIRQPGQVMPIQAGRQGNGQQTTPRMAQMNPPMTAFSGIHNPNNQQMGPNSTRRVVSQPGPSHMQINGANGIQGMPPNSRPPQALNQQQQQALNQQRAALMSAQGQQQHNGSPRAGEEGRLRAMVQQKIIHPTGQATDHMLALQQVSSSLGHIPFNSPINLGPTSQHPSSTSPRPGQPQPNHAQQQSGNPATRPNPPMFNSQLSAPFSQMPNASIPYPTMINGPFPQYNAAPASAASPSHSEMIRSNASRPYQIGGSSERPDGLGPDYSAHPHPPPRPQSQAQMVSQHASPSHHDHASPHTRSQSYPSQPLQSTLNQQQPRPPSQAGHAPNRNLPTPQHLQDLAGAARVPQPPQQHPSGAPMARNGTGALYPGPPGAGPVNTTIPSNSQPGPRPFSLTQGQGLLRILNFSGHLANESSQQNKLSLLFWQGLVREYFTPAAVFKFTLWKDNGKEEAKPFEIGVPILPRFFLVTAQSGVKSMTLSLDGAIERNTSLTTAVVNCVAAVWTYKYFNGYTITLKGPLVANIVAVPLPSQDGVTMPLGVQYSLKLDSLTFDALLHEKSLSVESIIGHRQLQHAMSHGWDVPMQLIGSLSMMRQEADRVWDEPLISIEGAKIPEEPVNAFGIPQATMRCLELAESVGAMGDLITYCNDQHIGPVEALIKYAEKLRASPSFVRTATTPSANALSPFPGHINSSPGTLYSMHTPSAPTPSSESLPMQNGISTQSSPILQPASPKKSGKTIKSAATAASEAPMNSSLKRKSTELSSTGPGPPPKRPQRKRSTRN